MAHSNGGSEEGEARAPVYPQNSPFLTDSLHELANAVTAVLMNAQVLEWKLPPYSRLKRPVREIERHAQCGGALLQRLLHQFEATDICPQVPSLHEAMPGSMAAVPGPDANAAGPGKLPPLAPLPPAPGSIFLRKGELTSLCDRCTSVMSHK
jgi:hypothetical protein